MTQAQFFLVVPDNISGELLKSCTEAAVMAAPCASILVPETITQEGVAGLQALGLAVIVRDCEPRMVHRLKADGLHISRSAPVNNLRKLLNNESIGVFAATSRHIAMEAAEAGADYIAFSQKSQKDGEPLISWWVDIFEVPAVAFDPVEPEDMATLLAQLPDFIRPSDAMWQSPEKAKSILSELGAFLK